MKLRLPVSIKSVADAVTIGGRPDAVKGQKGRPHNRRNIRSEGNRPGKAGHHGILKQH